MSHFILRSFSPPRPALAMGLGVGVIVLSLGFVTWTWGSKAEAESLGPCPLAPVSLDEGYGVARTAMKPVCQRPAD